MALGDGVFDKGDLARIVALFLARTDRQVNTGCCSRGLGAFLHGDEERVG